MNVREEFFRSIIQRKPTSKDCAKEFLQLRETYGNMMTRQLYCLIKGISQPALLKALKELEREQGENK